jgi:hypothetical protein
MIARSKFHERFPQRRQCGSQVGRPNDDRECRREKQVDLLRVEDEKSVEEAFEPAALILEEEAIPPAKEDD